MLQKFVKSKGVFNTIELINVVGACVNVSDLQS